MFYTQLSAPVRSSPRAIRLPMEAVLSRSLILCPSLPLGFHALQVNGLVARTTPTWHPYGRHP